MPEVVLSRVCDLQRKQKEALRPKKHRKVTKVILNRSSKQWAKLLKEARANKYISVED